MVGTLLNHGAKLNAKNHWSETALHVVSRGTQDHKVDFALQSYSWSAAHV